MSAHRPPLTLDSPRKRLWTWLVRLGIGYGYRDAHPGWIPEHQRQCCLAEDYLRARLAAHRLPSTAELRCRNGEIEARQEPPRRGMLGKWWNLCSLDQLLANSADFEVNR